MTMIVELVPGKHKDYLCRNRNVLGRDWNPDEAYRALFYLREYHLLFGRSFKDLPKIEAAEGNTRWIAAREGFMSLAGFLGTTPVPLDAPLLIYLHTLWVSPPFRRRGIARSLVRKAIELYPLQYLVALNAPENRTMHRLNRELGFQEIASPNIDGLQTKMFVRPPGLGVQ